jgi:hypothetical protein
MTTPDLGQNLPPSGIAGDAVSSTMAMDAVGQNNPKSIAQSTSHYNVHNIEKNDYIYKETFSITTSMPEGTIIACFPNHPSECNYLTDHFSKAFNCWNGTLKGRLRMLGTAFFGGSVRVGILPPTFSESQIRNMPLENLTSYPNCDHDPKDTGMVMFEATDQRNVAYHYNTGFNPEDPSTFGCWIVIYVTGRLVTQSADFTSISFYVETKGNYEYAQPKPLSFGTTAGNPLESILDVPSTEWILGHSFDAGFGNVLQVVPSAQANVPFADHGYTVVGGKVWRTGDVQNILLTNEHLDETLGRIKKSPITRFSTGRLGHPQALYPVITNAPLNTNYDAASVVGVTFNKPAAGADNGVPGKYKLSADTEYLDYDGNLEPVTVPPLGPYAYVQDVSNMTNAPTLDTTKMFAETGRVQPFVLGESAVVFGNIWTHRFNPQTVNMQRALKEYSGYEPTVSYMYHLVNSNGSPIMTLRLNPNGLFTTAPSGSAIMVNLEDGYTLRFIQRLPITSPLPSSSSVFRVIRGQLAGVCRNATLTNYTKRQMGELLEELSLVVSDHS